MTEQVAPFPSGDAVRIVLLGKTLGIRKRRALVSALSDQGLEVLAVGCLLATAVLVAPRELASVPWGWKAGLAGGSIFVAAALVLALSSKFRLPRIGKPFVLALFASLLLKVVEGSLLLAVARVSAVPMSPEQALVVLAALHLAIAVPIAPANLGSFEAGIVAPMVLLGYGAGPVCTVAILFHIASAIPLLSIGLLSALREGVRIASPRRGRGREMAAASAPPAG